MKTRPDHIHQLMTEKLAAVISATDEHYLDELIERDPVLRQKWEALQQACMPSGAEKSAERLRSWPATAGELLAGKTVPLRARGLAWKRFVGAAARSEERRVGKACRARGRRRRGRGEEGERGGVRGRR